MAEQNPVFTKCAWRLIPFMVLLYVVSFIDRSNVGYAALTMNKDLGFSPKIFGFGAGMFFVGYALFQLPANVILERIGAKRWMFCILAVWGLLSAANAMVKGPMSFYTLRFLLGVAEAGFTPGMILYLTFWFPRAYLARVTANFMIGIPLSYAIGGPISGLVLGMGDVGGLRSWQWLFLIEGIPAFLLSLAVLKLLPDGPRDAAWLTVEEKNVIATRLAVEMSPGKHDLWAALRDSRLLALGLANFVFQASAYGVAIWLPQIVHAMGFSNVMTGFILVVPFWAGACAMILCGRSSSSRGERIWHTAVPWLIAAVCFVIASVAQSHWTTLAALTIASIGVFSAYGPFFSLPPSFLRSTAAASGIALCSTLGSLGGFFGPSLMGVLREGSGDYATGMVAVAIGFVLAALIVLAVGRALALRPSTIQPAISR
jgi:MFS transporter, ACS family, tartrate transporter